MIHGRRIVVVGSDHHVSDHYAVLEDNTLIGVIQKTGAMQWGWYPIGEPPSENLTIHYAIEKAMNHS